MNELVMKEFASGCVGGALGTIVGHPFDTVKVRLQMMPYKQSMTMFKLTETIIKNESILGLFKGLLSPMAGLSLINSLVFGSQLAALHFIEKDPTDPTLKGHFIAGLFSGLVQSFATSPVELIKIRLQLSNVGKMMPSISQSIRSAYYHKNIAKEKNYSGNLECIKKIISTERGIYGLTNGLVCTMIRDVPFYGIYFWKEYRNITI